MTTPRTLLLLACALLPLPAWAAAPPLPGFAGTVRPLLRAYCVRCHNRSEREGGVDLASLRRAGDARRVLWKRAARRIAAHEMPPDDARQPTRAEKAVLLAWMKGAADFVERDPARQDPGPSALRRLTRTEYQNTVRDLLGVHFDASAAVGMPADNAGEGRFENLAANLPLSDALTEKYFAAAEAIADKVFAPGGEGDRARRLLFVARPGPKLAERDAARRVLAGLARRAYRRPPSKEDLARLLRFYDKARAGGAPFEQAVRAVLKPVLVSPRFLFRVEQDRPGRLAAAVDAHELAVRLSYFLWASMPDALLMKDADAGTLAEPAVLRKQVRRMLADGRARALTEVFGLRWLQVDALAKARPSTEFFPAFTHDLRRAMRDEVALFLDHLRTEDRSVLELLDADHTFANETLARHYGIAGVKGREMRKVALKPEHHRGGLLGMAAPLALTSHTSRTSPTQRGKYVLEVVFGTPPPPPPPNVPPLPDKPAKGGKKEPRTLREQLAAHAAQPSCAACHKKIDPLGFALDNYDAIGAWRDKDRGKPLDVAGTLPDGTKVDGVAGLKKAVLARKAEFARNLAGKMLEYALGRELDDGDEAAVRDVHEAMEKGGHRFSALIEGVAGSVPFRQRRARK